jgi:hypothetical protein
MPTKEVTTIQYEASDGTLHPTYQEASAHEAKQEFVSWYNHRHDLISSCGESIIDIEDILIWIEENKDYLSSFFFKLNRTKPWVK